MKPIRLRRTAASVAFLSSLACCASSFGADYLQNFDAADGTTDFGDGSVIKGNLAFTPSAQGNALQLTTNASFNNSTFHIPALAASSTGWTASFDFAITDNTANGPGEGFSFSYGPIAPTRSSTRPEEGWPGLADVLSFEIDLAAIGSDEVGPAIGLNRPSNIGSVGGSTHPSSLAFTNGDMLADNASVSGTATISWFPGVGASFTTTGLSTNANFSFVPTPGFAGGDTFAFAIAGRTTAFNAEVLIDNLEICVGVSDSDGDGLPDPWESANGLDPNSSAGDDGATGDPDGDTINNAQEFANNTDPQSTDTDGDTLADNVETNTGTWISASDTGTSPIDDDSDDDGLTDGVETNTGTFVDANDTGSNPNLANTDGDGLDDGEEVARSGRDPNVPDDPDPDTVYIQNFDSVLNGTTELGDGTAFAGSAIVVDGYLQLTTNDNGLNAAFHIPARVDSSKGWRITFDYTVIDNTGNPAADGFAFSYGALPFGGLSTVAEEGFPGVTPCLSFEMDTWDSGGNEWGPTIGVDRPAAQQGTVIMNNGPILNDDTTVSGTISIVVLPNGTSSFTSTGAVTNADFEGIATGFEPLDEHTFAFTARTGGANEEVRIDNIELLTGIPDADEDGLADAWETANNLDPLSADGDDGADGDPDGDGSTNLQEQSAGTDPQNGDSDGDGLSDSVEDAGGTYVGPSQTGTSPLNPDSDSDGLPDGVEDPTLPFVDINQPGTDPNNANTDGDGADDGSEILVGRDPTVPDDPPPSNKYSQDFDLFPDGTQSLADNSTIGSTNNQSAAVIEGQLRLTEENVGSTWASFRIPALRGSSGGFSATFDFTITDSPGNNNPADGFSFSYGAIPPLSDNIGNSTTGHGFAEEAWTGVDHLSFEVDTWDAASDWGVNIASDIGGSPTDHAFTNGSILDDGTSVTGTATISWDPSNGASFTTTGLLTNADFQNVPIPGFTGDDEYIFAFSSRTGGAFEDLFIDNIVITTGGQPMRFDVEGSGDNLVMTWESKAGRVYDLVSSTTLDTPISTWLPYDPGTGPLTGIPTTAPENVETIARPADPKRFFAIVEKEAPAFFDDDFESDQGWIVEVDLAGIPATTWERGDPSTYNGVSFPPATAAGGSTNCFATNIASDYGSDVNIYLRSPVLDLTGAGIAGAKLELEQFLDTDGIGDFGSIRAVRASDNTPLGADIADLIGGFDFDWNAFSGDLPPEAVGEMIRLEFQFTSDGTDQFSGWHIDNVKVKLQ